VSRIHGELLQLGFEVSEPTVSRYLQRLKQCPNSAKVKRWLAFLHNHREVIAAFDFFTVPAFTFRTLYCFFVIEHDRRKILHFHVTQHPTAEWVLQQLREAIPESGPYRYVILDRDTKFDNGVITFLKATGLKPKRTSIQSPWQKALAPLEENAIKVAVRGTIPVTILDCRSTSVALPAPAHTYRSDGSNATTDRLRATEKAGSPGAELV
jgi:hypothetical protein